MNYLLFCPECGAPWKNGYSCREMTFADIYAEPKPENPVEKVRHLGKIIYQDIKKNNVSTENE
jgi:hypothetical protein